jgi:uncharacterized phage protein (TIGR01671 family)
MRPIKFRAWDRNIKDWLNHGDWWLITPTGHVCFKGSAGPNLVFPDSDQHVLMEFTGLLDKNGKEIYEGDILRMDAWDRPQQVKFIEGAFCLADKEGEFTGDIHYIHYADIPQASVIGNIYENPEH